MNELLKIEAVPAYEAITTAQRSFVDAYIINGGDAFKAYLAVYPHSRPETARSVSRVWSANGLIRAAVAQRSLELAAELQVTQKRIIGELARVSFSTLGHFLRKNADGSIEWDFSAVTDDDWAAVSSITIDESESDGERGYERKKKITVKLHDKMSGLSQFVKMFGMQAPDMVEHNVTVKSGDSVSSEELARIYAAKLASGE